MAKPAAGGKGKNPKKYVDKRIYIPGTRIPIATTSAKNPEHPGNTRRVDTRENKPTTYTGRDSWRAVVEGTQPGKITRVQPLISTRKPGSKPMASTITGKIPTSSRPTVRAPIAGVAVARGGNTDNLPSSDRRPKPIIKAGVSDPSKKAIPKGPAKVAPRIPTRGIAPAGGGRIPSTGAGTSRPTPTKAAPRPVTQAPVGTQAPRPTAPTAPPVDPMVAYLDKAAQAANDELAPKLSALARELELATRQTDRGKTEITQFGQRAESDLAELYKRLGGFQQNIQGKQNTAYDAASSQVNNNFGALQGNIQQAYNTGQANTNTELSRLGIQAVAPEANREMVRDQSFLGQLAGVDQANAQTNIGNNKSAFSDLMALTQANSAAQGSSAIAGTRQNTQKGLQDLINKFSDQSFDINGRRSDVEGQRGALTRQIAEQYEEKAYGRSMEERQIAFSEKTANANLAMAQARLKMESASNDIQRKQAQLEMQAAEVQIAQAREELKQTQNPTPVGPTSQDIVNEQRARQIEQEINNFVPKTPEAPKPPAAPKYRGAGGAVQWVNANLKDKGQQAAVTRIINYASSEGLERFGYDIGDPLQASKALPYLVKSLQKEGIPNAALAAREIIAIMNGSYSG